MFLPVTGKRMPTGIAFSCEQPDERADLPKLQQYCHFTGKTLLRYYIKMR